MEIKRINLLKFRGNNSTYFTGRPQGEDVRKELNLDNIDNINCNIVFEVPIGTTSINPSFYLGMLFKSFKKLGEEEFNKKYQFDILEENEVIKKVLLNNLDDAIRNAKNAIKNTGGFKKFL